MEIAFKGGLHIFFHILDSHIYFRALRIHRKPFIRQALVFMMRILDNKLGGRGKEKPPFLLGGAGAEDQNRTGDTLIFSQVLYQLSYLGTVRDCTSAVRACQANIFICLRKLKSELFSVENWTPITVLNHGGCDEQLEIDHLQASYLEPLFFPKRKNAKTKPALGGSDRILVVDPCHKA